MRQLLGTPSKKLKLKNKKKPRKKQRLLDHKLHKNQKKSKQRRSQQLIRMQKLLLTMNMQMQWKLCLKENLYLVYQKQTLDKIILIKSHKNQLVETKKVVRSQNKQLKGKRNLKVQNHNQLLLKKKERSRMIQYNSITKRKLKHNQSNHLKLLWLKKRSNLKSKQMLLNKQKKIKKKLTQMILLQHLELLPEQLRNKINLRKHKKR